MFKMRKKFSWEARKGFVNVETSNWNKNDDYPVSKYELVKIEEYLENGSAWFWGYKEEINDEERAVFIAKLYKSGNGYYHDGQDSHHFLLSDIKKYAKKYIKIHPEKFVV